MIEPRRATKMDVASQTKMAHHICGGGRQRRSRDVCDEERRAKRMRGDRASE
jgi:hypothetical protein